MNNLNFSVLSTLIKMLLSLGTVAIYSNSLPFSVFSYFASGLLFSQILMVFVDSGVNNEILRFGRGESRQKNIKRLRKSTSVRLIVALFLTGFCVLGLSFYSTFFETGVFASSFLGGIFSCLIETRLVNLKAKNEFKKELEVSTLYFLCTMFFSVLSFIDYRYALLTIVMPRFIVFYMLFHQVMRRRWFVGIKIKEIISFYMNLKYYSMDTIVSNINLQLDSILVIFLFGKETFSIYQPLNKLYLSTIGFSSALASYFVPKASLKENNIDMFKSLLLPFILGGSCLSLMYYLLVTWIVETFFGKGFSIDKTIIISFSALIFVRYLSASFGASLMLFGYQKQRAQVNLTITLLAVWIGLYNSESYVTILNLLILSQLIVSIIYVVINILVLNKTRDR